mmetsp:Transcript_2485/g.3818  ORF Transcript_2485/g.3818 Transcript_2485/m.3818 type:complete len:183 (-) Transcript_2485:321-869(-)
MEVPTDDFQQPAIIFSSDDLTFCKEYQTVVSQKFQHGDNVASQRSRCFESFEVPEPDCLASIPPSSFIAIKHESRRPSVISVDFPSSVQPPACSARLPASHICRLRKAFRKGFIDVKTEGQNLGLRVDELKTFYRDQRAEERILKALEIQRQSLRRLRRENLRLQRDIMEIVTQMDTSIYEH